MAKITTTKSFSAPAIALSILAIAGIFLGINVGDGRALNASFALVPTIIILLYLAASKETQFFTPSVFILINVFLGTSLQSYFFSYLDTGTHSLGLNRLNTEDTINNGIFILTIGCIAFLIGYQRYAKRRVNKTDQRQAHYSSKKIALASTVLLTVSLAATVAFIIKYNINVDFISNFAVKRRNILDTGVIETSGYLRALSSLSLISFALSYVSLKYFDRKDRFIFVVMVLSGLISVIFPIITSARFGLLQFLITFAVLHNHLVRQWRIGTIINFGAIIVVLALILSVVRFVQQSGTEFSDFAAGDTTSYAVSTIAGSNSLMSVGKTAAISDTVPNIIPYYYGKTYLYWLMAPIPRDLWPDKPNVKIGLELGQEIFNTSRFSGIPPGAVGELYLNFGLLGVPIGMLIFGLIIGWYYNNSTTRIKRDPFTLVIYSSTFPVVCFLFFGSDFTGFMIRLLQIIIPTTLVLAFCKIRSAR